MRKRRVAMAAIRRRQREGPALNPARAQLLDELAAFGRAYDAQRADRRERLRNLEPESARLLWLLLRLMRAHDVLELGTSNGYSTIWLADGVGETGARVTTVELHSGRARLAAENFVRAGVADRVTLRLADAAVVLAESPNDAWDVIFLDAERRHYSSYWPDLLRSLRPLGLLAVDNALSHKDEVAEFRQTVEATPMVSAIVVPVGAGLLLITKEPSDSSQCRLGRPQ